MPINVPPHPGEAPRADAPAELWSRYLTLLGLHQAALIANQKSADEAECAAATSELAAAQRAYAVAFASVQGSRPTREELVREHYMRQPHINGLSDLQAVDLSITAVDAYLRRFPQSTTTPPPASPGAL